MLPFVSLGATPIDLIHRGVAAENPLNPRYALVVIAGLSPESTYHTPALLFSRGRSAAEVLVLPNKRQSRALVVPARELVADFDEDE